MIWVGMGVYI